MKHPQCFSKSNSGQGGLVAVAVTIMIALVVAGATLTGLQKMNATRTVVMRQSLQTYYVAQAGVQEALATRMMPRSNVLKFVNLAPQTVIYPTTGEVRENATNAATKIGIYRYLVVGGDPALDSSGNYYANGNLSPVNGAPRVLATENTPDTSPFYIISNGLTCKAQNTTIGRGAQAPTTTINPTCPAGYTLDEVTLVAEARLEKENGSNDSVDRQWVFKDRTNVKLPTRAFVPGSGGGWTDQVNFDQAWAAVSTTNTPSNPAYIVFYNFIDNTIYASQAITGTTTNIATQIPANAVMRLYFKGPVDYRSLYRFNMNACKSNPSQCNVQVVSNPGATETVYGGNTLIPVLPSSSQFILLPPLDNTIPGGTWHEIRLDGGSNGIKSYSGAPMSNSQYTIRFKTQP